MPWWQNLRFPVIDREDNIWMIKQSIYSFISSVDCYNTNNNTFKRFFIADKDLQILSFNTDNEGNIIVAQAKGLFKYDYLKNDFNKIFAFNSNELNTVMGDPIQDNSSNVWCKVEQGLLKYHPSNQKVVILSNEELFYTYPMRSNLVEDNDGNILTNLPESGFVSFKRGKYRLNESIKIKQMIAYGLGKDNQGNIWCVGEDFNTNNCFLLKYTDLSKDPTYYRIPPHGYNSIVNIDDIHLMLSTGGEGILLYNKIDGTSKHFTHNPDDSLSLSSITWNQVAIENSDTIYIINENGIDRLNIKDEKITRLTNRVIQTFGMIADFKKYKTGQYWLACSRGLVLFDIHKKKTIREYLPSDGYPVSGTNNILIDKEQNLWLGTYSGLVKFDVKQNKFEKFDKSDGLPFNKIFTGLERSNGELIFGGEEGLFSFHPDSIPYNQEKPNPVLTKFKLFNEEVEIGKGILDKSITYTDQLELAYDQNVMSFTYSALSFANSAKNQYAYYMEGIDKDWNYVGNQTNASYAGLTPGDYTFHLKASNNDGLWNDTPTTLSITILPPWWQTTWAYFIYTFLFASLLYSFYRFQLNRKLELAETQRTRELNVFKSRFYTNITHEFRTPLTVILGLAEEIDGKYKKIKSIIKQNSLNLLQLVNQLLDLSKLEAGMLKTNMQQGDVILYLHYIFESFHSLAEQKEIHLHFKSEVDKLVMDYDADKLLNIVSNLLTNAIKFTPENGSVMLACKVVGSKQEQLQLIVKDTGIGIAAKELNHIFDRFYQVDTSASRKGEGTGIGLSLTYELVKLLNGEIKANSILGQGSEFIVELPITNQAVLSEEQLPEIVLEADTEQAISDFDSDLDMIASLNASPFPTALIVEDNVDLIYYLRICLQDQYDIEVARNGQEGINKAMVMVPDIIISDVMMPEKNGYELCRTLKQDITTSHIPIILLTAKAGEEDKLEGLKAEADAYLTKPFNKEELRVRLKNLVNQRKSLWKKYKQDFPVKLEALNISSQDQRFLQKLNEIMQKKKSDADFSTESLVKEMGVSRTLLHEKLKALTGQSTSEFIRNYRLDYAAKLIKANYGNFTQIAYEAGFNDQSYFTKTFRKKFGMSPSQYAKSIDV
ncbi:MAG: hypothetical protein CMO01_25765 [Thalassobius sp.]|nr:hypothetical protein [Thalassovita sp.]